MYHIAPYPSVTDPLIRVCSSAISAHDVKLIRDLGDEYVERHGLPGKVGFHEASRENHAKRRCRVGWFHQPAQDARLEPVYAMLGEIAQSANAAFWQLDLTGFYDLLQYVVYDGAQGDHFGFHRDAGDGWHRPPHKLAIVAILSSPDEYEGGAFQIFDGEPRTLQTPAAGDVYVFPSWTQHRVLPVTSGTRRSLVGWIAGPKPR